MSVVASTWPTLPLSEVGLLHCGQSPSAKDVNPDGKGTRYITGPEQWDGHKIHESKWTPSPKRIVPDGCIFITVKGSGVGKIFPGISGAIGRDIYAFQPSCEHSTKYIEYALKFTVQDILLNAVGDIPGISKRHILDHEILVPPLTDQERIVAEIEKQFSRLDGAIANLKRVKANLKRYKAAVLKAAVEGKLTEEWRKAHPDVEPAGKLLDRILAKRRAKWEEAELAKMEAKGKAPKNDKWKEKYKEPAAPDDTVLANLPEGWVWASIGLAFDVYVGATPSRAKPAYWGGGVPWVSSGEVAFCRIKSTRETISVEGLENSSSNVHPVGTVLLGMIGEGKTRGQVAILDIEACNNQNSAAIRVSETNILPEYVYSFLEKEYEDTRRRGSGGNQPALNKERVKQIAFPLPPIAEQQRIVAEVDRRLSLVREIDFQVNANFIRSGRLRQSILEKVFSRGFVHMGDYAMSSETNELSENA